MAPGCVMRSLVLMALVGLLLAGCGQTGDLYLPDDEPRKERRKD